MTCRTCGGTGRIYCAKSWFPADGYTKERCGVCGGTGESLYQPDPQYARRQIDLRGTDEALREAKAIGSQRVASTANVRIGARPTGLACRPQGEKS
jgi:hypothetical protein